MNIFPDIRNSRYISIDVETYDPNLADDKGPAGMVMGPGGFRGDGKLLGIGVCTDTGWNHYYPLNHEDGANYDKDQVIAYFNDMLKTDIPKVGANLPYDLEWLLVSGINVNGPIRDIQIAEPLLDEERPGGYSLDSLAFEYLGERKDEVLLFEAAEKYGIKLKNKKEVKKYLRLFKPEYVGPYCCSDTRQALGVWMKQIKRLEDEELLPIFELESKLIPIFLKMKQFGVRINVSYAEELKDKLNLEEETLKSEIKRLSGLEIDCWSSDSIASYFDQEGMKYKTTGKGNPSFEGEFLADHEDKVCNLIAEWRKVNTMKVRYVEDLLRYQVNDRIHACIHQLAADDEKTGAFGTRSGRLSYSHPNLQKIPKRDDRWRRTIRSLFLPEEGCFWGQQDYSQQEPRLGVHYAILRNMSGAIEAGEYYSRPGADFHTIVATMANIERFDGKTLNLGSWYGMGKDKMMRQLKRPRAEAEVIYEKYHAALPFVKELLKDAMRRADSRGWVRTILGRKAHFMDFVPVMPWEEKQKQFGKGYKYKPMRLGKIAQHVEELRQKLEDSEKPEELQAEIEAWSGRLERVGTYKALNRIIQGSAADQTKKSIIDIYETFGHTQYIQIQVHDELDGSYESENYIRQVRDIMQNAVQLRVPVVVEPEIGPSWGEVTKWKDPQLQH